ncbi:hypothetical protein HYX12_03380 [Candidatus Woesearchaeota archaeon]|nr:hypothetical protein [Candidatus Woesearchaeota archaeon]
MEWKKYLTREFSFLYISYAVHCYKLMKSIIGATIDYDIAHGQGKIVTLYGQEDVFEKCYNDIEKLLASSPEKGVYFLDRYESLLGYYHALVKEIEMVASRDDIETNKLRIKGLLLKFDETFTEALCYYLFLVYAGYGATRPFTKAFIERNTQKFNKLRNSSIDTMMNNDFPRLFAYYDPKLKEIAPFLTREELLGWLEQRFPSTDRPTKRKIEYLLITKKGETIEYFSDIKNILKQEIPLTNLNLSEITGKTACPGLVKGKVVVVITKEDYKKIKPNAILITPMTKPDILPYLKSVKAIVTNDGGALSHASIISRELNIPCVVNTIHATEIFKDGNVVEVDANNGKVRKLKKDNFK